MAALSNPLSHSRQDIWWLFAMIPTAVVLDLFTGRWLPWFADEPVGRFIKVGMDSALGPSDRQSEPKMHLFGEIRAPDVCHPDGSSGSCRYSRYVIATSSAQIDSCQDASPRHA